MRSQLTLMMAITTGATVANLYYNQPLLALLANDFHTDAHRVSFIPTLTQMGHALGILLLAPLGDLVERRRLIVTMMTLTAVALAGRRLHRVYPGWSAQALPLAPPRSRLR